MQNESSYHRRLHALVEEALQLAAHEQDEAMIRLAGGDLRLLADARKMLAVMGDDGAFGEEELMERRGQLEAALDSAVNASDSEFDEPAPVPGSEGWIPDTIGPYSIRHVLGRGGTGVVFAAHQARPDRAVALKVLHPSLASAESTRRLMKEADALGRMQHPGIAQIFEAGTFDVGAGDQPFLAMELIEGAGLVAHAETASLSIRQRMDLVARICDAVEHAHSRGVVHRDLKPENIIVTEDGQPKLVDFGIASVARDSAVSAHGLTADGQVLGTVAYMAPEQARATRNADWRLADVFSVGAIAFELVTGTRPRQLEGLSLTQVISEITGSDIPSARKLNSALSRDIDTIIGKATMSEPRSRYQTVAALRADIRRTLQERTILARAPGKFEKAAKFTRRNRTLVASALAIALALVTGTVIALVQARAAQRAETESVNKLYAAEMLLASQSVMQPVTRARTWEYVERWEGGDVPLGWEWHLLASVRRLNVVALDVPSGPYGVAWRPDGRAVAVSTANRVGVFDADSGEAISVVDLESSDYLMQGIVWAADGERLVCGGLGMLLMWEPGTRPEGGEPSAGRVLWKQPIWGIKAPLWNGRSDTVVCLDTTLKCFDAETGELRSELPFKGSNANGPRLSPNGELVCSWDYRGYLTRRLDDWSVAVKVAVPPPEPRGQAWHPRGDRIAYAGIDGVVRVLDAQSGAEILRIDEFYEAAYSVDWHPTLNLLLASGEDGTVRIFDAENGSARQVLLRHQSVVEEARWSPSGDRVASVAVNGEALVWSLDERPALRSWYDPSLRVDDRRASLEPVEGRAAFKVVTHEMWRTYGLDSNEPEPFKFEVGGVVVSGSGVWRASDGENGVSIARVDSTSGGVSAFTVPIGPQPRLCKAWSPRAGKDSAGKDVLLALGGDGLWRIEPQEDGPPVSTRIADAPSGAYELAWSPDASMVCISRKAHGVRIVDADSGDTIVEQSLGDQLGCSAAHWSADSTQVALACADGALRSISASSGDVLRTWRGHANQVEGVAWSPDGLRIAGGSRDRTVKVWDTSSGDVVASFDCKGAVADVLWLAEGAVLTAVDVEGRSYAWDARRSLNGAD